MSTYQGAETMLCYSAFITTPGGSDIKVNTLPGHEEIYAYRKSLTSLTFKLVHLRLESKQFNSKIHAYTINFIALSRLLLVEGR